MRAFSAASAVSVAAAVSLLCAPSAYADGVGGTLELRDAATGEGVPSDGATVCSFSLAVSGFDGRQVGWKVVEVSSGTVAETDAVALDADGRGQSGELALRDGHYRLVWQAGNDGATGQRMFEVDCDGRPEPGAGDAKGGMPGPSPSAEPQARTEDGAEVTPVPSGPSGRPSAASPAGPGAGGSGGGPVSSPEPSAGGGLADTGSRVPAGALATAGASLLGAGTYLVLCRRERRSQRR